MKPKRDEDHTRLVLVMMMLWLLSVAPTTMVYTYVCIYIIKYICIYIMCIY